MRRPTGQTWVSSRFRAMPKTRLQTREEMAAQMRRMMRTHFDVDKASRWAEGGVIAGDKLGLTMVGNYTAATDRELVVPSRRPDGGYATSHLVACVAEMFLPPPGGPEIVAVTGNMVIDAATAAKQINAALKAKGWKGRPA